mgnify:CR=1 FL=1
MAAWIIGLLVLFAILSPIVSSYTIKDKDVIYQNYPPYVETGHCQCPQYPSPQPTDRLPVFRFHPGSAGYLQVSSYTIKDKDVIYQNYPPYVEKMAKKGYNFLNGGKVLTSQNEQLVFLEP